MQVPAFLSVLLSPLLPCALHAQPTATVTGPVSVVGLSKTTIAEPRVAAINTSTKFGILERRRGRLATVLSIVLTGVMLLLTHSAFALDPALDISQYAHTAWKISDGFTKGMIVAIAQGPDGYLWLGTEFGLARFDGVRAVPWQPPAGQQLPSNNIQTLRLARDGTLWIGTLGGLASWKDGKLNTYPEMAGQMIISLLQDHEDTIWAGGFRIPAGAKLCSIRNSATECYDGSGSLGVGIYGLYEDAHQTLWVGTNKGFWRWKPGAPQFFPAIPQGYGIRGFGEDDEHALLVSVKGGISRFVSGRFEARPLPYRVLTTLTRQIFRDRDGGLWIATFAEGLVHVRGGRVDTFSLSDGLSGDTVYGIVEDREGNVWVATNNGIDQFRAYTVPTISRKQGLGNTFLISTLAARDGSVWIARAGGLERWDHGKISTYGASNEDKVPGRTEGAPEPSSLFQDSRGRIWGATDRELGYLNAGRLASVHGYPGGYVRSIAEAPEGHLWAASDQAGLLEIFGGRVVQQLSWRGLGFEKFGDALVADPSKKGLWIGFWQGGIAYFADSKIQASYSVADGLGQGSVTDLRFDSRGTLWVGTDGGLSRVRDGHISTLTSRNGLPCDVVHWSIEDDDGVVWLYMPCGLARIAREELDAWAAGTKTNIKTSVLDASDGVGTHTWVRVYRPPVTKTQDGKIWFTTSDGVSILDPHHLPANSLPPPVFIEQIAVDGKSYDASALRSEGMRMPPRTRNVAIDYTALSLSIPEKVRFRFRLEGQDQEWREVVNVRSVQYSNLRPGNHRFLVKASNNSGVWNEEGASLDFTIAPAYYQTNWFRALCVGAVLVLLWAIYRIRVGVLEQRQQFLEQNQQLLEHQQTEITALNERLMKAQEEERSRIAGELHDGALQKLTLLSLSLGSVKRGVPLDSEAKEKIGEVQRKLIEVGTDIRQLSHELHPAVLRESGLPAALCSYCEEFSMARGIPVYCETDEAARDLSAGAALCIYRIAQEALGNVAKHSGAKNVQIRLTRFDSHVCLSVSDDGVGFAPDRAAKSGGLGLINMRERVRQLNGTLQLESEPGQGTTVRAQVPFGPAS